MKYNPVIMFFYLFTATFVIVNSLAVSGFVQPMDAGNFIVAAFVSAFWATVGYFMNKRMN